MLSFILYKSLTTETVCTPNDLLPVVIMMMVDVIQLYDKTNIHTDAPNWVSTKKHCQVYMLNKAFWLYVHLLRYILNMLNYEIYPDI